MKAQSSNAEQWKRLKEIFTSKSLQMVSFTITEKGYALQKADGTWFPFVEADIKNGPDKAVGAMAVLVAMPVSYTHLDVYKRQVSNQLILILEFEERGCPENRQLLLYCPIYCMLFFDMF